MANIGIPRFLLKRSLSVDSIQTGTDNANSRMHFPKLLRLASFSNLYHNNMSTLEEVGNKITTGTNNLYETIVTSCQQNQSLSSIEVSKRTVTIEAIAIVNKERNNVNESKEQRVQKEKESKKAPRRRSSYCDEYSKRESDRQGAREAAALLVRAHKVKKELSERNLPSYTSSHRNKPKTMYRRRSTARPLDRTLMLKTDGMSSALKNSQPLSTSTTTTSCIDSATSKIKFHMTLEWTPTSTTQKTRKKF